MSGNSNVAHHEHNSDAIDIFGFWLYIMTDCVLFGTLFAAFVVLHQPDSYGPSLKPFIDLYYVLAETICLLLSNLTFGLAIISAAKNYVKPTILLLVMTFILGLGFVGLEVNEFVHLVHEGYSWTVSGSASAFFALVATHGLHVTFGLIWIVCTILQISKMGLSGVMHRRLTYLGLFWNFLDIVWIFLFTVVYLIGAL